MSGLVPDDGQIGRFFAAAFSRASSGAVVSLRGFYDDADGVFATKPVRINGSLDPVILEAADFARACARAPRPVVFAPPICTFNGESASEANICEGLVLSVELDKHPTRSRQTLTAVIGQPTLTIASGGEWTDPETGETEAKLHLHWVLSEPTMTPEEHAKLKRARTLACDLAGGDATSKSPAHPMRCPGSVHRKGAPRLAQIIDETDNEIDLNAVLEELEGLAALRGIGREPTPSESENATLDAAALLGCAQHIPNDADTEWDEWNTLGMAFWRASDGSEAGFKAFDDWSAKSPKYDAKVTEARWKHFKKSPPKRIGSGTLVYRARQTDPNFLRPEEPEPEEAEFHDDSREYSDAGDGGGTGEQPFPIYTAREVLSLPKQPLRIEAIGMPQRGLGAFVGPSGHGKGLLTEQLGITLAHNLLFRGECPVEPCAVAIIVAEGFGGIPARQRAVYALHGIADDENVPLYYVAAAPQIDNPVVAQRVATSLAALTPCPRVVLVDTYRSTNSGDENDSTDAAKYVRGMATIATAVDGFVCAVAHSPWNAERERGSTAFRAAMDWVAMVQKDDDIITLTSLKSKDGPEFKPLRWRIEEHADSATVVPIGDKEPQRSEPRRWDDVPENGRKLLLVLSRDFGEDGATTRDLQRASRVPESSYFRTITQLKGWGFVRKEKQRHLLTESGRGLLP